MDPVRAPAFRDVPYMGVIYVVAEAAKLGFRNGDPQWSNLGQGQPEVGELAGAPERFSGVSAQPQDHAYGPVGGIPILKQAVADHYNRLFRSGKRSKYTADNVAIAAGGRLALSRLLAALGDTRIGYQTPDYTAYEDLLWYHAPRVTPVLVTTSAADDFRVSPARLEQVIQEHRLGAYLVSNPCNPTGQLIAGDDLAAYVDIARRRGCSLLLDEFYSHFIYTPDGGPGAGPISAASYVDDVDRDPVILIDGLTKNFRYPGWRVGWIVGPTDVVEHISRAASAIDGGPPAPMQRAAAQVLQPAIADQETNAVRQAFARKRNLMLDSLRSLGVRIDHAPLGTFYMWGDISGLPAPFNDADELFRAALQQRVMLVPGRFFDVNPGATRPTDPAYRHWMRFSFGPPEDNVRAGLERLRAVVRGR